MSSSEEAKIYSELPLYRMADWYNKVWALSSVFYESIPANKAGKFFDHLQEMFEVHAPNEILFDLKIYKCIRAIGLYCRILGQLTDYSKAEFEGSICSIISTDYGRKKVYAAARYIEEIANEFGYLMKTKVEDYSLYDSSKNHAFMVSHAILYALDEISENHASMSQPQKAALEFYRSLIRFVIYSGSNDHKLVPSYVTTRLAKLFQVILSHPVALTLPGMDDFFGRECLNECAPIFYEDKYSSFSPDLALAAASIQDLIEQLQSRGLSVDTAQKEVAQDIAEKAKKNPTLKEKLIKWGQSLGDETVSDVVKEMVKLAIRTLGIPIP